jgi:hypothetical protein
MKERVNGNELFMASLTRRWDGGRSLIPALKGRAKIIATLCVANSTGFADFSGKASAQVEVDFAGVQPLVFFAI